MPIATGTALAVGGSLLGGVLGSNAASDAAEAQAKAARYAADLQNKQYQQTRSDLSPYRDTGATALSQYRDIIGLNGQDAAKQALTQYTESPYLPGLLRQTQQNVDASNAARGGLFSGATAQQIGDRTGQLYLQDYGNYLSRLSGLYGTGENAAAQTGQFGANAARAAGDYSVAAGNAQANGAINTANSWNNALSNIAGAYGAQQGGAFGSTKPLSSGTAYLGRG